MIRVLFVIPNFGHGGAEKVLTMLVNNMDLNKFKITVLSLYDEGVNKQYLSKEIEYRFFLKKSFPGISHLLKLVSPQRLFSLIIKDEYDVIVSYLEGQTARIVSGSGNHKTSLLSWIHVEQFTPKKAAESFRSVKEMNNCYNRFDNIVCVAESVKKDFVNITKLNKKPIVIYNTVDSDKIRLEAEEALDDYAIKKKGFLICAMGTLKKSKGFDRLIRIHKRLLDSGCKIQTIVLGEGSQKKFLERLIHDVDIADTFSLIGYHNNPYKYLKASDLFVCTSYAEGFSTAVTEALIVGTPTCTVNVSGMNELLGYNNEYGIVTANDDDCIFDAIYKYVTDTKMQEFYKKAALERGKKFNKKETVSDVESLISDSYLKKMETL